ncbi:MAG: NUDIX domain-containing protein [Draconibacterium sp.]
MGFNAKEFLESVSIDCVVFGFHNNQLKVLLLKMKYTQEWSLPGGFVKLNETVEDAAARVLRERTKLSDIFLKQFRVFSDPERSNTNPAVKDLIESGDHPDMEWFAKRFISIGMYALVDFTKVIPVPDIFSEIAVWKGLDEIGNLILDHNRIVQKALDTLRLQISYQPIGYNLMPEKFTMPELQSLYETILGKTLDRRNFQRKILSFDILNKLPETKKGGAHKAPFLYEFNLDNYKKALENGLTGGW